jgi:hypothetical protein
MNGSISHHYTFFGRDSAAGVLNSDLELRIQLLLLQLFYVKHRLRRPTRLPLYYSIRPVLLLGYPDLPMGLRSGLLLPRIPKVSCESDGSPGIQ